jgi:hypothetical protein
MDGVELKNVSFFRLTTGQSSFWETPITIATAGAAGEALSADRRVSADIDALPLLTRRDR